MGYTEQEMESSHLRGTAEWTGGKQGWRGKAARAPWLEAIAKARSPHHPPCHQPQQGATTGSGQVSEESMQRVPCAGSHSQTSSQHPL